MGKKKTIKQNRYDELLNKFNDFSNEILELQSEQFKKSKESEKEIYKNYYDFVDGRKYQEQNTRKNYEREKEAKIRLILNLFLVAVLFYCLSTFLIFIKIFFLLLGV